MGPTSNLNFFILCQRTPLHIAVREGQMHTVERLVTEGANINIKDNDGVSNQNVRPRVYNRYNLLPRQHVRMLLISLLYNGLAHWCWATPDTNV